MEQEGQTWIDTLPISTEEPFTFLTDTDAQKRQIERLKTEKNINLDATAEVTLNNLLADYKLMKWTCTQCGFVYTGNLDKESAKYRCPECGAGKEQFHRSEDAVMARKVAGVRYQMEIYGSSDSTPFPRIFPSMLW